MPEDKNGKPSIKPKPATFCVKRNFTHHGMFPSASASENATSQTPQPMPRKLKHKANADSAPSDHAFVSTLQQTKPPEDIDAIITIPISKSTISFDDENANAATSDTRSYSTISRTIEKKVFFKNYSYDAGTKESVEDEIALTRNASTMAKVCWKSEEFLAVEPVAAIEEIEVRSESLASLDDIPCSQQLARIEPSPERFLDDILRKKKLVKIFSAKGSNIKDLEEIEAALLSDPSRLSNIIPSVNECIRYDDDGDYDDGKSSFSKRQSVEYVNLMDSKNPPITKNLPFYANLQPHDEDTRKSMTAEDKEQIRRMNWFFGVKKDTKTDLEMEVFNSIVSGNALATGVRTKVVRQQQLQKGRRRLSHLKSNVKDSPTSHASGQLLQDLNRVKKWAIDKVPVLNKMRNKSTDDLLAVSRSNQSLSSWGHPSSTRSSDWSTWKQKFIKVMKKHFTSSEEEEEEESSTVVVATFGVPLEMCPMSSNNKHVPAIVEFCITVVEHLGLTSQGIYRIPGNNASVNALLSELNKDPDSITFEHDRWQDVNVIGSLLKLFFRKLPEPLIITEIYDEIIHTAKCMNREKKLIKLKLHLLDLPATNRETFKYLANHLKRVAANQAENKMDAHNLAIMFGPSLVHPRTESTNQMLSDMKYQTDVVENIIKYCDWMFSEWTDDSNVPRDEGDQGYNIQCSASNPELLANAEAILAFKPSEPEPKSPEGSFSFFRNGLIRLSGRGKIRRKSGRSEAQVGIISNSEREVQLKTVNLDNITRLVRAWKSHTHEMMPLKQELKRNLTQRYASRELEISAPLRTPPSQSSEEVDELKNEESVFSSIKRYPAYSFKNTTITGSGRKVRSKNHNSVDPEAHGSKPFLSESIETLEGNRAKASEISQCSWNFQDYARSGESETSEVFAQVGEWAGRKESFVVRKPEGRSYFASADTGEKLFPVQSCSSRMKLTRLEMLQEVESFSPCQTDLSCTGRRMFLRHRGGEGWSDGDIPLFILASPCHQ